ncbi:MAG TPA: ATP-binding protein [Gemmatimonadaceae bacterium]|nr:ATP-binding protein [Gemmatimonadaceae bacterium]
MTLRLVVTGGECTGKTTLAAALAARLDAPWLPEAARAYAEDAARQGRTLSLATVEPIAMRHIAAEEALLRPAAASGGGNRGATPHGAPALVVYDTDLLSTVAYSRHYYGTSSAWLEAEARARRADLYLLCAPDIPWTADGVRDRPEDREAMFAHFGAVLREFGAAVTVVRGTGEARVAAALAAVHAQVALPAGGPPR